MKRNTFASLASVVLLVLVTSMPCKSFALEEVGGVGMEVYQLFNNAADDQRGNIVVVNVFKESPAEKQGIKIGDIIIEINGENTWKQDFSNLLLKKLRGPVGNGVKFKIYRPSTKQIIYTDLVRVPIVY